MGLWGRMQRASWRATAATNSRPPPDTPWYVKLLRQMIGGFQLMMIAGAVLCWIAGPLSDPVDFQTIYLGIVLIIVVVRCVRVCVSVHVYRIDLTITIVVVSTGFFAFLQERKSDSVMAGGAEGLGSNPLFYLRFRLKPFFYSCTRRLQSADAVARKRREGGAGDRH